jgi:hypothetical protein
VVAAPEVVAAAAAMPACSCCDTFSMAAACSREAVPAAWMVVMATTKSDGATLKAVDVTTMWSGSEAERVEAGNPDRIGSGGPDSKPWKLVGRIGLGAARPGGGSDWAGSKALGCAGLDPVMVSCRPGSGDGVARAWTKRWSRRADRRRRS